VIFVRLREGVSLPEGLKKLNAMRVNKLGTGSHFYSYFLPLATKEHENFLNRCPACLRRGSPVNEQEA